jgi:hypothetical protein
LKDEDMLMPRKPALLLHLLNLVLKPIARQTKASSNLVELPQLFLSIAMGTNFS